MKKHSSFFLTIFLVLSFMYGCTPAPPLPTSTPSPIPLTFTPTATPTQTATPTPVFLPLLSICSDGITLCEGELPTILRGANVPNLIWADSRWDWGTLGKFKTDVLLLKGWGANFVIIQFDPERIEDSIYAEKIVKAAEFSRSLGLHVELMHFTSKLDLASNDWSITTIPLAIVDIDTTNLTTNVSQHWVELLSHPGMSERLSKAVDIFGIFSEPAKRASGQLSFDNAPNITWSRWRPRAEKACQDIRAIINREAICSISGIDWGGDIRGLRSDPFQIPSVAAEVHIYQGAEEHISSRANNWGLFVGKVPIIVGEFGYTNPPRYITELLADLKMDKISWAAWPGPSILWEENDSEPERNSYIAKIVKEELSQHK